MDKKLLIIVEKTKNNAILIGSDKDTSDLDMIKAVFSIFEYTQKKYPEVYNEMLKYVSQLNKENAVLIQKHIKNANNKINKS